MSLIARRIAPAGLAAVIASAALAGPAFASPGSDRPPRRPAHHRVATVTVALTGPTATLRSGSAAAYVVS